MTTLPRSTRTALASVAASAALLVPWTPASAVVAPDPTDVLVRTASPAVAAAPDVDVALVQEDLQALQDIAEANGGNREAGSPGYEASIDYVEQKLVDAGFEVTRQQCDTCYYPSENLIADWPGGDVDHTVMFGAHLDGVSAGAGINDNGSGSMAQLEAALAIAEADPEMAGHLRFAWWTDEEQGLNGSDHYVNSLTDEQAQQIQAYYNFDMVGSPNGGYFVNHVDSEPAAPLATYYADAGITPEENEEGAGRSDDYSFEMAGIPTSGVAAGASAVKTEEQAEAWGGTAGEAYDSCYHSECDTYPDNVDPTILDHASDAIAFTAWDQTVTQTVEYGPAPQRRWGPLAGVPLR